MPVGSLHVDDVEAFYEQAAALGLQIVHPLTTEAWGVRRFFVQAPKGNVFNIVALARTSRTIRGSGFRTARPRIGIPAGFPT
ncbi:VOC family protein [Tessaracoccus flavescens]|uniref:VOC family protein n=1 Tax=Tessaracoccus flavescens TaxID=399497 RepID=UPI0026AEB955